jgi:tripartite-type tricarboxylate transporter receptor subunit TctC
VGYILTTRAGVPAAVSSRLEELLVQILREPEIIQKITALGITPESLGASGTAEMLKREAVMYRGLVTKFKVTVD